MTVDRKTFLRHLGIATMGAFSGTSLLGGQAVPRWRESDPESFWSAVRGHYEFEPGLRYFNSGGLGPAPRKVREAAETVARELQWSVETGRDRFEPVRRIVADFFGAAPEEVAFVRNATEATGIIATGLSLSPGDEVIFESHAHPGGSFPWLQQQQQRGIRVRLFEPDVASGAGNVERIAALLTPRTRVVQVSHVTAPTGLVLPVQAIARRCRAQGIWFHVDGAQAAGMIPVNVRSIGCDSYAASGHKWLGGPHETGVLCLRRERLAEVTPLMVGAHSAELAQLPGTLELGGAAAKFEYGTRHAAPVVALALAATWQDEIGRARIAQRGRELAGRLRAGLRSVPEVEVLTPEAEGLSASMLTFRSPRMRYDVLFQRLFSEHRMRCRPVSEQQLDAVRVSCHLCNTRSEIDDLVGAIDRLLRSV